VTERRDPNEEIAELRQRIVEAEEMEQEAIREIGWLRAKMGQIHPRVWKLQENGRFFLVVGEHEPYFPAVYLMIRGHERAQGTWTEHDEQRFQEKFGQS